MDTASIILSYLLPIGIIFIAWSNWDNARSRENATTALLIMSIAVIAYATIGFGLQFGGVGLRPDAPLGLRGLDRMWSPFSAGQPWGMIGLEGFLLNTQSTIAGDTALLFTLFLHQLPIVITTALIPTLTLAGRARTFTIALIGIITAAFIVPITSMWSWGNGWLSTLGGTTNFGHGFIDPGGASASFIAAGMITLAALIALKLRRATSVPIELPRVIAPLRSIFGAIVFGLGWLAWLATDPFLSATRSIDLAFAATNILLGMAASTLLSFIYGWFTTGKPNAMLTARGAIGGCIALSAAAPFVPTWGALIIGGIAGLWIPIGLYVIDRLHMDDSSGSVAIAGLASIWSLISIGFLANGVYGAGWNNVGLKEYLGAAGQGVTGLLADGNLKNDPGQMSAQITGLLAISLFAFVITWLLIRPLRWLNKTPVIEHSLMPADLE
jgi:Amt family ammonium transporter